MGSEGNFSSDANESNGRYDEQGDSGETDPAVEAL